MLKLKGWEKGLLEDADKCIKDAVRSIEDVLPFERHSWEWEDEYIQLWDYCRKMIDCVYLIEEMLAKDETKEGDE